MSENSNERKGTFLFYEDWWKVISNLESSVKAACFDALCEYAFLGKSPGDPTIKAITGLMLSTIDRDTKKWNSTREQRRKAVQKRWDKAKKNTNVSSRNTKNTNVSSVTSRNTNDTDNVNVNVPSKEGILFTPKVVNKEDSDLSERKSFIEFWKEVMKGTSIPSDPRMTDTRWKKLQSLVKTYGKETVVKVIRKIPESSFLRGENSRGFKASFDFLIGKDRETKTPNFLKILEGNFDDGVKASSERQGKNYPSREDQTKTCLEALRMLDEVDDSTPDNFINSVLNAH